jgi:hypothetical protein
LVNQPFSISPNQLVYQSIFKLFFPFPQKIWISYLEGATKSPLSTDGDEIRVG